MKSGSTALFCLLALAVTGTAPAEKARFDIVTAPLDGLVPDLLKLYEDLHQNPELSEQETRTSETLAARLRSIGFEVTTGVGGHGIVGVLRNGEGPTVLLRTDLDALPVEENTGVPYASRTPGRMHACGHDLHMTAWIGTATLLARARDSWHGTIVVVGQPAEEIGVGARAMLKDGLFERFPKPDFAFALHTSADHPAGRIAFTSGWALANVDSVDVTIFGKGGHGAYPHRTIDPIVIAARTVVALQTIVARENNPLDPAVVTVGSFHAGTKHNVIPDEAKLQLTVRSYTDEVHKKLLAAIERIVRAEAAAGGAPREPEIKIDSNTPATWNDPELTKRVVAAIRGAIGNENVVEQPPVMGGEDFSEFGRAGVPAAILWVGGVDPEKHAAATASGTPLPSLHSALFAPEVRGAIPTAVRAETAALLELLK
jgi:amidohydrolase